jgi:DNA invertase Pin-like site-specific DNA recombinase
LKVAIYARVSTSDQSCETQLRELSEYAARRGWIVTRKYVDTGWSGTKASRPELDRLIRDASRRQFDVLLVYKLDRFGRSVLHLNQQLAALTSYGIRFISTSQALDTDQANPTSRLLLQILASVAEFEREMIRERTLSGIRAAKANGKRLGRPKRVFRRDQVVRAARRASSELAGYREGAGCSVHDCNGRLPKSVYGKCLGGGGSLVAEMKEIVQSRTVYE